jgi:CxxC motif-containing protein (DUF1111 family)
MGLLALVHGCSIDGDDLPKAGDMTGGPTGGTTSTSGTGGGDTTSGGTTTGGTGTTGGTTTGGMMPPVSTCGGTVPATFTANCSGCHTQVGAANSRYPDLYKFQGTLADFTKRVREGSPKGMAPYPPSLVSDADIAAIYSYFTGGAMRPGLDAIDLAGLVPLFQSTSATNLPIVFKSDDGVLVTRGAGRVRGRHEGPLDTNQPFMEFVTNYFTSRTYGWIVEDFTVKGESRIRVTYLPIANPTGGTNFRAWKMYGNGDVFTTNGGMTSDVPMPSILLGGKNLAATYPMAIAPFARIQQHEMTTNTRTGKPIQAGDLFEFEFGIFIDGASVQPAGSRTAYYTDTFRYKVGTGGVTADNPDPYTGGKGILGPVVEAQQGGDTTNVWPYFMPETQFGQMALNVQHENVQSLVRGRRLFHTDFATGAHSETPNPTFPEQAGKAGPLFTTSSCETCHAHNGPGELLKSPLGPTSSMSIKLYNAGSLGAQLQTQEGSASVSGVETKAVAVDGTTVMLSRPKIALTTKDGSMPGFSARIARKVIGMGLLEAIDERTILTRSDPKDCNGDGISGRPTFVKDPASGVLRLGRFGWKAEKVSVEHQIAEAAFDDMGVGTKLFPDNGKTELSDAELSDLVTYMRLVSVPGQRSYGDTQVTLGSQIFKTIGCAGCHVTDVVTGSNHPFSELRNQDIKPYSDLLLHDMGPDLADDSGLPLSDDPMAAPAASEWRTPPLWGTGLGTVVNGHGGLLHDGRAASVLEAVLWHGGEAEATKQRVIQLPAADRNALLAFVQSL